MNDTMFDIETRPGFAEAAARDHEVMASRDDINAIPKIAQLLSRSILDDTPRPEPVLVEADREATVAGSEQLLREKDIVEEVETHVSEADVQSVISGAEHLLKDDAAERLVAAQKALVAAQKGGNQ